MSDNSHKRPSSAEMHGGPGFRIRKNIPRPAPGLIAKFRRFPTPDISDQMNRLYAMSVGIRQISGPAAPLVGPACTVKVYPGDNLMVHKALDIARPGDVVVVDTCDHDGNAIIGDMISNKARHRGIAGFIIDGFVRDLDGIEETGLPVFARGVTPIGPLHRGPGELNYAVSCGGIVVNPGDVIVGDENGVVVVRREFAARVLERLYANESRLEAYVSNVKKGVFSTDWVDDVLQGSDCAIEEGSEEEASCSAEAMQEYSVSTSAAKPPVQ